MMNAPRRQAMDGLDQLFSGESWGLQDVAYVKAVTVQDQAMWAIFSADGNQLGLSPNRDLAFAAAKQHDLEPMSAH